MIQRETRAASIFPTPDHRRPPTRRKAETLSGQTSLSFSITMYPAALEPLVARCPPREPGGSAHEAILCARARRAGIEEGPGRLPGDGGEASADTRAGNSRRSLSPVAAQRFPVSTSAVGVLPCRTSGCCPRAQTEQELFRLRHSVHRGTPFGGDAWTATTAAQLGLESALTYDNRTPECMNAKTRSTAYASKPVTGFPCAICNGRCSASYTSRCGSMPSKWKMVAARSPGRTGSLAG
jgi:hypothetical protein